MLSSLGPWVLTPVLALATLLLAALLFYRRQFRYWKDRNIPHTSPKFLFGDYREVGSSKHIGTVTEDIYKAFKGERFVGMWALFKPILLIRDPELIKQVFVKDFAHFRDRGVFVGEDRTDPLSRHLFSIGGNKWRNLRTKLTPAFSSGKIKMMFPIILDTSKEMASVLQEPATRGDTVEFKEILSRFTTDVIASCAFGIQANSLRDPEAAFRVMGRKIFELGLMPFLRIAVPVMVPKLAALTKIRAVARDISDFFVNAVRETIDYRTTNNVKRNDFMQLLMELMNKGTLEDVDDVRAEASKRVEGNNEITFEDVAAQVFVFFGAGFETSSTTMQFLLYELAKRPEIQKRCQEEILDVLDKYDNELTYEALGELEYTCRVIDETLRMYPVVTVLTRECNEDYHVPDSNLVVEKGITMHISTLGLHMDPRHFPNPANFDPDRFTDEEKTKRHHFAYIPFGEGPRNCIGSRFGLVMMKVGLVSLLSNFDFKLSDKSSAPLVISPKSFVYQSEGGMHLKVTSS